MRTSVANPILRRCCSGRSQAPGAVALTGEERVTTSEFRITTGGGSADRRPAGDRPSLPGMQALQEAVQRALDRGEAARSRQLLDEAASLDPSLRVNPEWSSLRDVGAWPDRWLVAAVRRDPPDEPALDTLVDRYWGGLFARSYVLTLDRQRATDLAQEAWCRVLRARRTLEPEGNFPAFLGTVATNLWRDQQRAARRAGTLADQRVSSLQSPLPGEEGESTLADLVPDLKSLGEEERNLLKLDLDQALGRLTPQLREVVVARFIAGESCAEIARRYQRTEQTVSGWIRAAIREMKVHLEDWGCAARRKDSS